MNNKHFQTFVVLCETLNYQKASETLFISPSAIHRQISLLENELGYKLFIKKGSKIVLTSAGKDCLTTTKEMLNTTHQYIKKLKQIGNKNSPLTIQTSAYIATYLLPEFMQKHPEYSHISILIEKEDERIYNTLSNNTCDIVISRAIPTSTRYQTESICEGLFTLVVPNDNKSESEDYYFSKYNVLKSPYPQFWESLATQIKSVYPNIQFNTIDDIQLIEFLISQGKGISYLPTYIVKKSTTNTLKKVTSYKITPPISHTYISWNIENNEINDFVYKFKEYIEIQRAI